MFTRFSHPKPTGNREDVWLSRVLRGGVNLSLFLVFIGFLINFFTFQSWFADGEMLELLSGGESLRSMPPQSLREFADGLLAFRSLSYVQASVVILILLPAVRVGLLLGSFLSRRDWVMAVFSTLVLVFMSIGTALRIVH